MNNILYRRIKFLFIIFCFSFFIILAKAFRIQIYDKEKFIKQSKKQFFRQVTIYPKRGAIYDRNNNPLAINIQTYSIFTIPKEVKGSKDVYRELSKLVPQLTFKKIKRKVYKRNRYTWLARKIRLNKEVVKNIKKLKGIYIESVPKRFYPNHELLSQALGFVGIDNVGLAGLEYHFNDILKGRPRILKYIKDAKGRAIKFQSKELGNRPKDIYLTIDKDLQAVSEKYLKEAIIKHNAEKGGIAVMDSSSGEILSIANYPSFDPNEAFKFPQESLKLSYISDPFEPGSILKTFTILSAFEHKIAKADTNYYCERGKFRVGNHVIKESDTDKKYEWLSISDILRHSSNIGTTKIAFDLTFPKLKETLLKFKFGEKTRINLPGESRGIFPDKKNVLPLTLSNISFGQGIATTGIQILSAYSAIANDGVYISPKIIKDQEIKKTRIISLKNAKAIQEILVKSVEDGTGFNAKVPFLKIAGKTSTAQKPSKEGGYNGYIAGFVGFPLNIRNRFVIYVYIDSPQGIYYGNTVAAPVFKKISEYLLYKNKDINKFKYIASPSNLDQFDNISRKEIDSFKNRFKGAGLTPNFLGLDKASAIGYAIDNDIKIINKGIGLVVDQSPKPGVVMEEDDIIVLKYMPPVYE